MIPPQPINRGCAVSLLPLPCLAPPPPPHLLSPILPQIPLTCLSATPVTSPDPSSPLPPPFRLSPAPQFPGISPFLPPPHFPLPTPPLLSHLQFIRASRPAIDSPSLSPSFLLSRSLQLPSSHLLPHRPPFPAPSPPPTPPSPPTFFTISPPPIPALLSPIPPFPLPHTPFPLPPHLCFIRARRPATDVSVNSP
ncbi:unnamed protein product [Closterium sp. NIES-65]|nr:unnamed protein product [Closterium sp. NIES-65]